MRRIFKSNSILGLDNLEKFESYAILFYIVLVGLSGGRGYFFLSLEDEQIGEIFWITKLDELMDLTVWGVALLVGSVILLGSVFVTSMTARYVTYSCNLFLGVILIFLSAAAIQFSTYDWTFFVHLMMAVAHISLVILGVYWSWIEKNNKQQM